MPHTNLTRSEVLSLPWTLLSDGQWALQAQKIGVTLPINITMRDFITVMADKWNNVCDNMIGFVKLMVNACTTSFPHDCVYSFSQIASLKPGEMIAFAQLFNLDENDDNLWLKIVLMLAYSGRFELETINVVTTPEFIDNYRKSRNNLGDLIERGRLMGFKNKDLTHQTQVVYNVTRASLIGLPYLPGELITMIADYLDINSVTSLMITCRRFLKLKDVSSFWKSYKTTHYDYLPNLAKDIPMYKYILSMEARFAGIREWLINHHDGEDKCCQEVVVITKRCKDRYMIGVSIVHNSTGMATYCSAPANLNKMSHDRNYQASRPGVGRLTRYMAMRGSQVITQPPSRKFRDFDVEYQLLSRVEFIQGNYILPLINAEMADDYEMCAPDKNMWSDDPSIGYYIV